MGDSDLLPKRRVELPDVRHLPFGPSGVLLADGPEFPPQHKAPDVKGLPWRRDPGEEWTSPEQRAQVLAALKALFVVHRGHYVAWFVRERDHPPQLSTMRLQAPLIELSLWRKDGKRLVAAQGFDHAARYDAAEFDLRIVDLLVAVRAQE